jgi:hypothetical protein
VVDREFIYRGSKILIFWIFVFYPYLDFWTCGNCSQAHFKISILTFRKVNIFENISKNLDYILLESYLFCRFQGLPAGCVCVAAACGASATSEKTRPWNFGAYILWILSILSNFVDFRVPKVVLFQNQDTCPFSKPRHLSFFKTKTSVLFQNQDTCPFSKPRHLSFFKTKTPVLFQNQDMSICHAGTCGIRAGTCGIQAGTCGICIMKWWHEVLLGAPLPHAPGVRMT